MYSTLYTVFDPPDQVIDYISKSRSDQLEAQRPKGSFMGHRSSLSRDILRVAGVCALGAVCLKRKSIPVTVSKRFQSLGVLKGSP